MTYTRMRGFTLLELSIVLMIIGVLIGGIMFGQSMITASRLQTVLTDADSYITATNNFKQQYQALPGDMASATSLWGTDSSCPSSNGTTATCNGNGNGEIGETTTQAFESFRFWQQLYDAKLFTASLKPVAGSGGTYDSDPATNVPAGSLSGSGFSVIWWGTVASGDASRFAGAYGNVLLFGLNNSGGLTQKQVMTPDQAASLDAKIDDGVPSTGKVRSYNSSASFNTNCTTSGGVYNVSNTSIACALIFVTGF
jgi:prepilin-type N-terminal cleavage/methylation domain-containing protein